MMKKILGVAALCFAALSVMAQKPATVTGTMNFDRFKPAEVKLFKVVNGKCFEIAQTTPTPEGKFGFMFFPSYEGLYVLGRGNELSPNYNFAFYFKEGDNLSVELTDWDYKLTGENTKENKTLYSWHQVIDTIYQKSINFMGTMSTYVDFFPQLEATAAKAGNWWNGKKTGNAKFDQAMPGYMKMYMTMIATNFLNTPRSAHPSVEEFSSYYSTIQPTDITTHTEPVYSFPWGVRTMEGMAQIKYRMNGGTFGQGTDMIKAFEPYILNDTLRGEMVLGRAASLRDYGQYKDLMDSYGSYILTDSQKLKQIAILTPLLKYKKGDDAFNFSYVDNHGDTTSLADMKGKVVMVDVWATWCGPCKAEIPYLKQLEEEMKGQDVQFVSISVDVEKDKQKWLHFIDTAKLGGTQLFAGGWDQQSGLAKYYQIKGIPRFMVFDKKGKIVSVDAPRPSTPELKKMLEASLQE
ncbi:Thiol-disulfide isomerase or thioredoxin [Arachidicoccus rhizosphaerae]|uniref:Thiol-disulfide isomerase or thioredoxin n=1 Tax=Arachidicoccus rhizosphaerae TaxID=551991 RepID=A0A1H3VT05_9BACT|nr:TlpA disulfide reductase family protein [Arachidicoccus rhizosphaerae]SDZ77906.1 Thiol-disulfide isomerase or thioredoxin [Arachidicoccus rhizosphaerae]